MTIKDEIEKAVKFAPSRCAYPNDSREDIWKDGALWAMRWWATKYNQLDMLLSATSDWDKAQKFENIRELRAAAAEILGDEK
jgi:hypothetical protein